jgi:hypothetical protein
VIDKLRRALVPLNTRPVGVAGVAMVTIGLLGPPLAHWAYPNLPGDMLEATRSYGSYLAGLGGYTAWIGLAPQIKSGP